MRPSSRYYLLWLIVVSLLFVACGGDENSESASSDPADPKEGEAEKPEPDEELPPPEPEPVVIPDPNGIYLTHGKEEKNGKPVYSNGEGFFMWFNGSIWKISDKVGGGRTISSGKSDINDKWDNGGKASYYPSKTSQKEALFSLAVACQGSSDNLNAIRLFEKYVADYEGDPRLPEAYLSLGDLTISVVKEGEEPTYEQISKARANYALVRDSGQVRIRLINDATFNEGGLLERIAGNPKGILAEIIPGAAEYDENLHYPTGSLVFDGDGTKKFYSAHSLALKGVQLSDKTCWEEVSFPDKDNDGVLSKTEFASVPMLKDFDASFADADMNDDKKVDFDETAEMVSQLLYGAMESLFREYGEAQAGNEGAQISQATEKIGFACEKQGRPSEMLKMYYNDIKEYGNDPMNVGVDGILKKYSAKYEEYDLLYGKTLDLLKKLQDPDQSISFDYTSRKGVQQTISGKVREILADRKKLLPWLSSNFKGMDPEIYEEVSKFRTAIFANPDYASKFRGYFNKYDDLREEFDKTARSPKTAFKELLDDSSGQRALELRMRAALDNMGAPVAQSYTPKRDDFRFASPAVLVWMAEKFMNYSPEDAIAAMERLIDVFGETGGEFLFDAHYLIGQAKEKEKSFENAAYHYTQALTNSSWHENATDARIRRGDSLFEVAKKSGSQSAFEQAYSSFEEVRGDTENSLELRARSSYMMGECRRSLKDSRGAAFLYLETTLNFPSAVEWVPKAFDQAISMFEQSGQTDQIASINKQYLAWQRKFLK